MKQTENTIDTMRVRLLDDLVKKSILNKKTISQEESYIFNDKKGFDHYYMYPSVITQLFTPIPSLLRKDYIFHLFYNNISPFEFYEEESHEYIQNLLLEYLDTMDKYGEYFELNVFKEYGKNLKNQNHHLYKLMKEKNKMSKFYYTKELSRFDKEMNKDLCQIKSMSFKKILNY